MKILYEMIRSNARTIERLNARAALLQTAANIERFRRHFRLVGSR